MDEKDLQRMHKLYTMYINEELPIECGWIVIQQNHFYLNWIDIGISKYQSSFANQMELNHKSS